jgi:predicted nucleic acid-binding protein
VIYLVDTNVLLEAALRRQYWESAQKFLVSIPVGDLGISTFTLYSLGFFLTPRTPEVFDAIVADIVSRGVQIVDIAPASLNRVTRAIRQYGLDFDDAFAYTVAEMNDLRIVSFDSDFDGSPRGRATPAQVLESIRSGEPPK